MTAAELWERLSAEGRVQGARPDGHASPSPWFVRVMLGVAGWIGAVFLILFVGAAFASVMDSAAAALVVGAAWCGAGAILLRRFGRGDFAAQFGLAISLAGQILVVVGLAQLFEPDAPPFYLAIAAMQAGLALAVPNPLHRLLATAGAAVALSLALGQLSLRGLAIPAICAGFALIWLDPDRWAVGGRLWRPIGYGLVLALLLIETIRLLGVDDWFRSAQRVPGPDVSLLVGRGLTAAVLVWAAVALSLREGFGPASRVTLSAAGAAFVFGLLSLGAPGLASASLVLLLGFAAGNRLLLALGIVSLLGFVAHFYYNLDASLLEKSGLLALTGLCLLAAHVVIRRSGPAAAGEPDHA